MLFQTTKNILFEPGASARIGELLLRGSCSKHVLIVTDPGVHSAGLIDAAVDSIKAVGGFVSIFSGVSPDPSESDVIHATKHAISNDVTAVVGLGGGSPMDVAKLAAFFAKNQNVQLSDVYGVGNCEMSFGHQPRLPLIQVPTTAGTGSEVTPIAIVTTGETSKQGVVSPQLLPDWAVLDGELTLDLPKMTTAHTGIDAMVHAIEAFTCATSKNPLSDMFAREALRQLSMNIRSAVFNGRNSEARGGMLLGSMYAGMAFSNAPVAAVHALAYPLGSHYKVPHGLSCSLMLPPVLEFNAENVYKEYAEVGSIVFSEQHKKNRNMNELSDIQKCDRFICGMRELIKELELPMNLKHSSIGVKSEDISMLASEAMKQVRLLPNNPKRVTEKDAVNIYTSIL